MEEYSEKMFFAKIDPVDKFLYTNFIYKKINKKLFFEYESSDIDFLYLDA